ncbi:unknown [Bacteroides sp. CAG:545]|nr:unknown [Bacteroides sp. CAG:545]
MLFTFAPNSTLFTSLPLTIGLTYGLLMLTILFGILSLQSLLWKWFFCWRYIFVMISKSPFSLDVSRLCASS